MYKKKKNLIVFDMDGVIVDVSESYREAVRQTARLFFQHAPGWDSLPDPAAFLTALKRKAGLPPNHWSATLTVDRYRAESFAER